MQTYLARVFRSLVVTCLGAGGGVGLLVFIVMILGRGDSHAFQFSFTFGLCVGLIVAVVLGVVFLLIDLTARLFLAKGQSDDIWKLDQLRELDAEGAAKEIITASRQALLAVPCVQAVSDDMEHLITRANIGQSWRSPGEVMEVEMTPIDMRRWHLKCTSRPKMSTTLFDYGKNFENVEVWQREFRTLMASEGPTYAQT